MLTVKYIIRLHYELIAGVVIRSFTAEHELP